MPESNERRRAHAQNMRELYIRALDELAKPYPAYQLPEWPQFNRMVGGLREREYTILCGSTGSGKTTLLSNFSAQFLKMGLRHFVMSVENGETDYMKRVISVLAGRDVNTGDPVPVEVLERIHAENAVYLESDTMELSLYDDRIPLDDLIADIDHMVYDRGCKVVFIDNLNYLLQPTRSEDAILEADRVTHELIVYSKRTPVHIVMVMHPRKIDGDCRVNTENDIKGSSTANQEAYNIFLWNRPRAEDIESNKRAPFDRELTFRKIRRRGQYVPRTLVFQSHATRYSEKDVL